MARHPADDDPHRMSDPGARHAMILTLPFMDLRQIRKGMSPPPGRVEEMSRRAAALDVQRTLRDADEEILDDVNASLFHPWEGSR